MLNGSIHARGAAALAEGCQEPYTLKGRQIIRSNRSSWWMQHGQPVGRIADGDAVIFCCRRGEREIQLTEAFTEPGFDPFPAPRFRTT